MVSEERTMFVVTTDGKVRETKGTPRPCPKFGDKADWAKREVWSVLGLQGDDEWASVAFGDGARTAAEGLDLRGVGSAVVAYAEGRPVAAVGLEARRAARALKAAVMLAAIQARDNLDRQEDALRALEVLLGEAPAAGPLQITTASSVFTMDGEVVVAEKFDEQRKAMVADPAVQVPAAPRKPLRRTGVIDPEVVADPALLAALGVGKVLR